MKICVITPLYAIAGVPLAQIRFAKALAKRGHDVDLIIGRVLSKYILPEIQGVNVKLLGVSNVRQMLFPLMKYIRETKPDVVFSAEDHLNVIVSLAALLARSKVLISGSSRVTPFNTYSSKPFSKRWMLKLCARAVLWRANALTCVSQDMVTQYRMVFNNSRHTCVYNIVDDFESRLRMLEHVDHDWFVRDGTPIIVAAGRLAYWKGFVDLIHAMKHLTAKRPARLVILGDGPQREVLQKLINDLELTNFVTLLGYVDNTLKYFSRSDVFVLSSTVEGMPNVLVEAMMCGCTPVSTNCPTGPSELLQNGRYGYLVPVGDSEAMADAIEKAIDFPIGKDLLREAIAPFEESVVIERHFEVLGVNAHDMDGMH